MSRNYDVLSKMTGISESEISDIQIYMKNRIVEDDSIQGRLATLNKISKSNFDETKFLAMKILNKINLYGLGIGGSKEYESTKRHSPDSYDHVKAESVAKLRLVLSQIEELSQAKISRKIMGEFINELYHIQEKLDSVTKKKNIYSRYFDRTKKLLSFIGISKMHQGGRIGQIMHGQKFQKLMRHLAESYVFLTEKERAEKNEKKQMEERYLLSTPVRRPQPLQQQVVEAFEKKQKERTEKIESVGKNLFLLIREQERCEATGIDRATVIANEKFEMMIRKTMAARTTGPCFFVKPIVDSPTILLKDSKNHLDTKHTRY